MFCENFLSMSLPLFSSGTITQILIGCAFVAPVECIGSMYQKALFILAVMCLFSLGMCGQYQLSPDRLTTGLTTSVYQILMLFLLAGEWTLEL
jgi:hypothetical protein